jgi:C4-dicarboxylate-specific signal transduction histidine kinase
MRYVEFQNLATNALKDHRPETPPVVQVSAVKEHGNRVVSVKDNGTRIWAGA